MFQLLSYSFSPVVYTEEIKYKLSKMINKAFSILSTDELIDSIKDTELRKLLRKVNQKIVQIYGETPVSLLFNYNHEVYIGIFDTNGKEIDFKNISKFCN